MIFRDRKMAISKRHQLKACTLALMAVIAFLLATSGNKQDSFQNLKKVGWGSPEEAFAMASRTIDDYIPMLAGGRVVINPQFRATLHSRSKIWTVKGLASCPTDDNQLYRWTVIMVYDGVQEWEVLAKIVTPVFAPPVSGRIEGVSTAQGDLFQADPGD